MPPGRSTTRKKKDYNGILTKSFVAFLLLVSAAALSYYFFFLKQKQPITFDKPQYSVRGVDLSHHNPIINWNELHDHNIHFVYLKATEGLSHQDRNYTYNYESARKSKIKTGSYHFYLFGASGKDQAKHFINVAKCNSGDLIPAIDVEHSPGNPYSKDTAFVNLVISELKILEDEFFEYYGLHPVIYTNKDCYKLYIKDHFPDNPVWMCDLHNEPSGIDNWVIWQFSHKGELAGVTGEIDLNYFRYSYDQFYKILIP